MSEKGYFKKFASRYGKKEDSNEYIKIFDLFDKMDKYDDRIIKNIQKKKSNYSLIKSYLYHQILKSLRSYNTTYKSPLNDIQENIMNIQILIEKKLNAQAKELIEYTKIKAYESENFSSIIILLTKEEFIQYQDNLGKFSYQEILKLRQESKSIMNILQQEEELSELLFKMETIFYKVNNKEKNTQEILESASHITKNKLLQNPKDLTQKGQILAYSTLIYSAILNNNDQEVLYYLKIKNQILSNRLKPFNTYYTHAYLVNTNNLIFTLLNTGQVQEVQKYISDLKQMTLGISYLEDYRKYILTKSQIIYLMIKKADHITTIEIEEAEMLVLKNMNNLHDIDYQTCIYYLSILFYSVNKIERSLYWLQKIIFETQSNNKELNTYCRLIIAYLYYDLNYQSLVESSLRSVSYYIKKENIESKFFKEVTSISKNALLAEREKQVEALNLAYPQMEILYHQTQEQSLSIYSDFNLLIWYKSKINKTSYLNEYQKYPLNNISHSIEKYWNFISL
ncbi:MAG: hypothetical protein M9958_04235 [Chitinophagales bacterium]|nr:hypothetical protein [Chitinophagales bacterium]